MPLVSVVMLFCLLSVAYSLPLNTAVAANSITSCEPGKNTCSKCYDVLVNEIISSDRNRFNIQNAFFPPAVANPVFVTVTYYFTRNMSGDGTTDYSLTSPNQTWFWTQSTFYLFQPINSLQYTSLLFADTTLRETNVSLYLEPDCWNASIEMMTLLTQRLKLYAMQQNILSPIMDSYSAKGENLITLTMFHRGQNPAVVQGEHFTKYGFAFQIVFPIIVLFFLRWLTQHLIENDKHDFFSKMRKYLKNPESNDSKEEFKNGIDNVKVSARNMQIYMLVICSVTFVLYVISLDIVAIVKRNTEVSAEIFYTPGHGQDSSKYDTAFFLEYSVTGVILFYDLVIFVIIFIGLICRRCGCQRNWYQIGIAPFSCIIVHSYHIIVGFIQTPHHALSILIFYAIVMLVFYVSLKAAYYNLFQLYKKFASDKTIGENWENFWTWKCCTRSRGVSCRDNIQNETVLCCCAWIFCLGCKCNNSNYWCCKKFSCCSYNTKEYCSAFKLPYPIVVTIMSGIAVFLAFVIVFVVVLFFFIPINMAIEDAPARLLNINQTVLVFIGAAITYKLYRNNNNASNIIERLVKANKEYLKDNVNPVANTSKGWDELEAAEKEVEMGKLIISMLHNNSLPPFPSPAFISTQNFAKAVTKVFQILKQKAKDLQILLPAGNRPSIQALVQALTDAKARTQDLAGELQREVQGPGQPDENQQALAFRLIPTQVQAQAQAQILQLVQGLAQVQLQVQSLIDVLSQLFDPPPADVAAARNEQSPAQALATELVRVKDAAKDILEAAVRPFRTQAGYTFCQALGTVKDKAKALADILEPAQDH